MASALSVLGGFDGVDDPAPSADVLYATLRAEGFRRSFSEAVLLEVLDKLRGSGTSQAFVTIESEQSFKEARLLQTLSEAR
jgi:hypothetical protein